MMAMLGHENMLGSIVCTTLKTSISMQEKQFAGHVFDSKNFVLN